MQQQRVYRFRDLRSAGVPFTRKHLVTLMRRGEFPQQFNLTDFSVAWVGAEVDAWVEARIRARRAPISDDRQDAKAEAARRDGAAAG